MQVPGLHQPRPPRQAADPGAGLEEAARGSRRLIVVSLDGRYNNSYTQNMKTAISIPDKVFESAEQFAHRMGLSRSELYATALKSYLEEHRNDKVTEKLNELYGETASDLERPLLSMQARSLRKGKW